MRNCDGIVKLADEPGLVSSVYTITFDANGGTVNGLSTGTTTDGKLTELPGAARAGYTFDGWFLEDGGDQRVTTDTVFSGDATVYAHWTRSGGSSDGSPADMTAAAAWAVENNVSDGRLNPEGAASRAHFAVFLQRFCTLYGIA